MKDTSAAYVSAPGAEYMSKIGGGEEKNEDGR